MIGLITAVMVWKASGLEISSSVDAILPANHPALLQDREIKSVFESREMILIGFLLDEGVFNQTTLQKVADLSGEIEDITLLDLEARVRLAERQARLPERYRVRFLSAVRESSRPRASALAERLWREARTDSIGADAEDLLEELRLRTHPVSEVLSLSTVEDIVATEEGLALQRPMPVVPVSSAAISRLRTSVYRNPLFVNGLVSKDGTGILILVEMSFYYDDHIEVAKDLLERLSSIVETYRGPETVVIAGVPMVNVFTSGRMNSDLARLMPLSIVVLFLVLWYAFRSPLLATVPLVLVLTTLAWTLGAMALAGRPVTLVVSAMPIILIAICVADGIHLITEYRSQWRLVEDKRSALTATMGTLAGAVVVTSLTDVAGFGSLASSGLASIRDFGVFTSVGALVALGLSLTLVPAVLVLLPPPPPLREEGRLPRVPWIRRHRRRPILIAAGALVLVAALLIPALKTGGTMVGYFKTDSQIAEASRLINGHFGGTEVLNVVVDTHEVDGLKDARVLRGIAAIQDSLEGLDVVGYTASIADHVARMDQVLTGRDQILGQDRVEDESDPRDQARIAQYLLLYENAGGNDTEKLADFDYRKANVVVQIRTDRTPILREVRNVASRVASTMLGASTSVTYAGCSNLCIVADDLIIPSQLRSLGTAALAVFLLLSLLFRSAWQAAVAMVPLVITIMVVFALMSLFGVHLDAVTALIASIVLGVGIDYSVHFISRFKFFLREGSGSDAAMQAVRTTARPILFNSLAVGLGFSVLLFSSFWPLIHIGWVVGSTMVLAAVLTLAVLPALLPGE